MSDLRELYQEVILDHNRRPRNFQKLDGANRTAEGYNPLCGDQLTVYLRLEDGVIKDISFQGSGCETFHKMVTADLSVTFDPLEVGKLAAFSGVREFPVRVKCATLPWHTLHAALEGKGETVSSE
ncbi:MAG: uncharacterized protein HW385_673 [candidate division NC10 bacterium]|nr:uncharacterized protein [candidate division NC10 bacterium]